MAECGKLSHRRRPGGGDLAGGDRGQREAARGVHAGHADGAEDVLAFELLDDARDGFKAQVGDVGDVLPGGQDDLSGAIGKQADQAEDAVDGLAAAQGDEIGGALLGAGQRGEQGLIVGRAFRPGIQVAGGQRGGAEGVGAKEQGFAAEDVTGDGQAGKGRFASGRGRVEADDAVLQAPRGAGRAAGVDFGAAGAIQVAAGRNATVGRKKRANLKLLLMAGPRMAPGPVG